MLPEIDSKYGRACNEIPKCRAVTGRDSLIVTHSLARLVANADDARGLDAAALSKHAWDPLGPRGRWRGWGRCRILRGVRGLRCWCWCRLWHGVFDLRTTVRTAYLNEYRLSDSV